jgi:hypothetical protein
LSGGIVLFDMSTSPVNLAECGPPLSLWNTTIVLSSSFCCSSVTTTRPISVSIAVIMAAYARRAVSAMPLYCAITSSGTWYGECGAVNAR